MDKPNPIVTAPARRPPIFSVATEGETTTVRPIRPAQAKGTFGHRVGFVAAVLLWACGMAALPTPAAALNVVVGTPLIATLAYVCFDFEKHKGRRRVRREITFRVPEEHADFRTAPALEVQIDGDGPRPAADARLVLVRFCPPTDGPGINPRSTPLTELSLVADQRVYVVAREPEALREEFAGEDDAHAPATVHGLAVAITQALGNRLPLDESRFRDRLHRFGGMASPWPEGTGLTLVLLFVGGIALATAALGIEQARRPWLAAAYLALFAALLLPAMVHVQAARTSHAARDALRQVYGDAAPLPGPTRWRPWPAFSLGIALGVAFWMGWTRLFPEAGVDWSAPRGPASSDGPARESPSWR